MRLVNFRSVSFVSLLPCLLSQGNEVQPTCGFSTVDKFLVQNGPNEPNTSDKPNTRIINGQDYVKGMFPWMAQINQCDDNNDCITFCGGALINHNFVLTAAHCFAHQEFEFNVKLGVFNQKNKKAENDDSLDWTGMQEFSFSQSDVAKHESYTNPHDGFDIAIVRLSKHVEFTDYVQPICLSSKAANLKLLDEVKSLTESRRKYFTAGWGLKSLENGKTSNKLQFAGVKLINNQKCENWFQKSLADYYKDYNDNNDNNESGSEQGQESLAPKAYANQEKVLCAGYKNGGTDACLADSGGPLMVEGNDKRWSLIGIVSWGLGCALKKQPGVYTRVDTYYDWIESKTRLDLSKYNYTEDNFEVTQEDKDILSESNENLKNSIMGQETLESNLEDHILVSNGNCLSIGKTGNFQKYDYLFVQACDENNENQKFEIIDHKFVSKHNDMCVSAGKRLPVKGHAPLKLRDCSLIELNQFEYRNGEIIVRGAEKFVMKYVRSQDFRPQVVVGKKIVYEYDFGRN